MKLYEKIMILRKRRGMSQEDLAKELEISRQSVYKWEAGLSYPEIDKIKKLSDVLKVSIDTLLNDDLELDGNETAAVVYVRTGMPEFRSVFVSDEKCLLRQSDYEHGYCEKSKGKNNNSQRIFNGFSQAMSSYMHNNGYTDLIIPQHDLAFAFFYDKKSEIFGFYFKGAERFVCPVENIIDVHVSGGGRTVIPNYTLTVVYFAEDGGTATYELTFTCKRLRHIYEEAAKHPGQISLYEKLLSDETYRGLNEIRNKITALKARGELIKNNAVKVERFDISGYAEACKAADKTFAAHIQKLTASAKKKQILKIALYVSTGILVAVAVLVTVLIP